jgi:transposase
MGPSRVVEAGGRAGLEQVIRASWTPEVFRRFQCVWLTEVLQLPAREIAEALGLNVSTVRRIRIEYARDGVRAITGKGNRGGRRNQCMSLEEETLFLRSHPECFGRSGIADVGALKAAFETHTGRGIHKTTIYRLLERHGRKRAPAESGRAGLEAPSSAARKRGTPAPKRRGSRSR